MRADIRRAWVNQPSTLQVFHKLHGTNVLVDYTDNYTDPTIYFLSGPVTSMMIDELALSPGWRQNDRATTPTAATGVPVQHN